MDEDNATQVRQAAQVAEPEEHCRARLTMLAGIATFECDPASGDWRWSPQAASLFGLERE